MDNKIHIYFSNDEVTKILEKQTSACFHKADNIIKESTICVNPQKTYQEWLGFGGIWTDTDIYNLLRLPKKEQDEIISAYFDPINGIGWNFIRVPFGSTDWESSFDFYTYDDMPRGETDVELEHFSIKRDIERGMFDLLKRCKAVNPDIIFLGSVWGVPGWMKDNQSIFFGKFEMQYVKVYAQYLRKTIMAYQEQGIDLYAVTTQNETLISDDRATPACRFTWRMQKEVLFALREELDKYQLKTKIWAFDDSYMRIPMFVTPLLKDEAVRNIIDGVAFHSYNGSPKAVSKLTALYPEIPVYHTERTLHTAREFYSMVEEMHNDIRSHINWSILEDEYGGPNQFLAAGTPAKKQPKEKRTGIYTYREDSSKWSFASAYGNFGQFSKFIKRGMKRIDSTFGDRRWLTTVSFMDERTKEIVTVVVNENEETRNFDLRVGGGVATFDIPGKTIATYCYQSSELIESELYEVNNSFGPKLPKVCEWDIEAKEIIVDGQLKEGQPLTFSLRVENVGSIPTPPHTNIRAAFNLDGITDTIAIAMDNCVLAPGESKVVTANVPVGKDITWKAEKGWHDILVFARMGGDINPENNKANNCIGKEIFIEE